MSKENSLEYWLDYIQTVGLKEIDLGLQRIKPIYEQLISKYPNDPEYYLYLGLNKIVKIKRFFVMYYYQYYQHNIFLHF